MSTFGGITVARAHLIKKSGGREHASSSILLSLGFPNASVHKIMNKTTFSNRLTQPLPANLG
jgi:hypothetical protein